MRAQRERKIKVGVPGRYIGFKPDAGKGFIGSQQGSQAGTRWSREESEIAVDADHIVHLSMSEGLDNNYPFGNSLLETI